MEMSNLETLDWLIIVAFFILSLAVGVLFTKKAGKNLTSFFLGGRNMTWWLAGVSMVATTFAADTPLAVTELVAKNGIAGNWLWWNFLLGGMLTTFFFARLWRRAEILTDVEFIEIRYSGKEAAFLRGFRSIYLGLFMNSLIIAWVNLALQSILVVFFNISPESAIYYVGGAMALTVIYSSLSGLMGVAVTDFIQFFIAMTGTVILAVIVVNSEPIGGIAGLKAQLPDWSMKFFPDIGSSAESIGTTLTLSIGAFLAYTTVQWWASWYPGAEPGGGGYIAQRMMSTKNEKHAIISTLFFQVAHYCIRPWPWILVGLCTLILYPELEPDNKRLGFVMAMKDFLPTGLKGLLLVAFFAAYMSTISTQLNWGSSYLIKDYYSRFVSPESHFSSEEAADKNYVFMSRLVTFLVMLIALIITTFIQTISGVWTFIIECGAGLGLVLIMRWFWWRINAWSEIVATIVPFIVFGVIRAVEQVQLSTLNTKYGTVIPDEVMNTFYEETPYLRFPFSFFIIVGITTVCWLAATFLTRPTKKEKLESFYQKIRPAGFWDPIRKDLGLPEVKTSTIPLFICWISATVMAYSFLFLVGKIIFQEWDMVLIYSITAATSLAILAYFAGRIKIFGD